MKLEAMNGNLVSLTMKVASQEKVEPQGTEAMEGVETEQQHDEGDKDGVVGGVKKKGARKKRSLNWEEAERGLLVEVIKPKVDYVENRSVDSKSIKSKRLSWMQITKQFNALNFRHRSLEQIQVQWRSMKNFAKREYHQKHPKTSPLEGLEMIEFMEEMQKDPISARSQTRGAAANHTANLLLKKELLEIDDEDTPLAALPTSTNTSEDTLQASTIALPSPPPTAELHNDVPQATPIRIKKKPGPVPGSHKYQGSIDGNSTSVKMKKQRIQNIVMDGGATVASDSNQSSQLSLVTASISPSPPADEKYKKQYFELMKRARLAEMDYARREHEQKLRFEQMEQEMKLNYYRQQQELQLRQSREEHEARMRHQQAEHEARMRAYTWTAAKNVKNSKVENNEGNAFN